MNNTPGSRNLGQRNLLQQLIPGESTPKTQQSTLRQSLFRRLQQLRYFSNQARQSETSEERVPTPPQTGHSNRKSLLQHQMKAIEYKRKMKLDLNIDLQNLPFNKKLSFMQQQLELQTSPFSTKMMTASTSNRIQYQATAVNYNNFVKKFTSEEKQLMASQLTTQQIQKYKIIPKFGPSRREFIAKKPIQYQLHTDRVIEVIKPKTIIRKKKQITFNEIKEKYSELCKNISETVNEFSQHKPRQLDIYTKLHIEDVHYTDLEAARDKPINQALFTMFKEEEIAFKQKQVEEFSQFDPKTMQKMIRYNEEMDERTHEEYRRRCYVEYEEHKSIRDQCRSNRPLRAQNKTIVPRPRMTLQIQKMDKRKRILNLIKRYLFKLNDLNLTLNEVILYNVFPKTSYYRPNSKTFFDLVKVNNIDRVEYELQQCRYLVYDFDAHQLTALHVAVIRQQLQLIEMLLSYHSDVNAKDILGRTPLFFAVRAQSDEIVHILLYHRASPWSNEKNKFDQYLPALSDKTRDYFRKAKNFHLQMQLLPYVKKSSFWEDKKSYFKH